MLTFSEFLMDLTNPALAFLPRALLVATVSALVCAVVGAHVVLRGMAFIGDAVAHAVFPGLAVAFVFGGSLVLGGAVAGILTAVLVALLSQNRRLKEDSVIGVLFVGAFAIGVVVISRAAGYAGSLQDFLFGSITGVPAEDIPYLLVGSVAVVGVVSFFRKELVAVTLDRETARAQGIPVLLMDVILYASVALAVVLAVQTVGNVLVLALLVTPAATARLLVNRLVPMMAVAAGLSVGASFVGIYLSWALDLPTGATIVCLLTSIFALAWLAAPRHGVLVRLVRVGR
ncbi:anchored repeat-type ABC transporter permease subunit [Alloscardovia macacae]|uniref:Anchored repeat-type ABC transporter permease subunit n=1 Tax=Alloscardovia macacae TaxID=1160091 RepID=A0A1Y2SSC9_9BIFI|nr:anchored repeat-type ABC transporter permease subunit [Alloscardovia macacae]OTA25518.1 anchored repeat-type ABC transporter permease subunit [Alloscardovia macacae]OTA28085.1 anchored repeat-type ABC transporter permease subunit [Alloscardovia macacae]